MEPSKYAPGDVVWINRTQEETRITGAPLALKLSHVRRLDENYREWLSEDGWYIDEDWIDPFMKAVYRRRHP